jgi:hypothetical protein
VFFIYKIGAKFAKRGINSLFQSMWSPCIYRLGKRVLAKAIYYKNYYKTSSLIIRYLGAFAVGEAIANVRRTQLAVVRCKCTNSRVTRKRDSDQTRPSDT